MEKNQKTIEVCLGVGFDQIFPSYQKIVIEKESEEIEAAERILNKSSRNSRKKSNRLGLINYEGDCIWAEKRGNGDFTIHDQYGKVIDEIRDLDFYSWIDGTIFFQDSKGKKWFYPDEHRDAKPSEKTIINFLKD